MTEYFSYLMLYIRLGIFPILQSFLLLRHYTGDFLQFFLKLQSDVLDKYNQYKILESLKSQKQNWSKIPQVYNHAPPPTSHFFELAIRSGLRDITTRPPNPHGRESYYNPNHTVRHKNGQDSYMYLLLPGKTCQGMGDQRQNKQQQTNKQQLRTCQEQIPDNSSLEQWRSILYLPPDVFFEIVLKILGHQQSCLYC